MKKIITLVTMLLIIFNVGIVQAFEYKPVTVFVPIRTNEEMTIVVTGETTEEYVIDGYEDFELTVNEPGFFKYSVKQKITNREENKEYDENEWLVYVDVNDENGELVYYIIVSDANGYKPDELYFENKTIDVEPEPYIPPETKPDNYEQPTYPQKIETQTTSDSIHIPENSIPKSFLTGDLGVDIFLVTAFVALSVLITCIVILSKKKVKK